MATFQLLLSLDAAAWAERCWLSQSSVPLCAGAGGDVSLLRHVRSAFPYPGVLQAEHVLLINPS